MRVNISLPDKLLKDLDNYCKKNGFNRSEFIRHLIRIKIMAVNSLGVGPQKSN